MNPYLIVVVQFTMGLAAYALLFTNYVRPKLQTLDFHSAIAPLLLVHVFRFLGLTLLAPGQVAVGHSMDALQVIAFGDLAAAVAALVAAVAAYRGSTATRSLAWLFTVVGVGDLVVVGLTVPYAGVFTMGIGGVWFLMGLVAPALIVSHIAIIGILLGRLGSGSRVGHLGVTS